MMVVILLLVVIAAALLFGAERTQSVLLGLIGGLAASLAILLIGGALFGPQVAFWGLVGGGMVVLFSLASASR